jgi:hypothetical protein
MLKERHDGGGWTCTTPGESIVDEWNTSYAGVTDLLGCMRLRSTTAGRKGRLL